jgi:UDP-N-acetylmuramoyl-L-alanyl-D-glutamate--2,6-diaminopimelate ligase
MLASADILREQSLRGRCPPRVTGLARDSRQVGAGQAYVWQSDDAGHAAQARERGAGVVIGHAERGTRNAELSTPSPRFCFARASAALHGVDALPFPLLAATGTKGKSTITHLLWWMLGTGAARIGTIGWHDGCSERPNRQTTPPPEELHAFLAGLPATCPGVALEASSHAGDQHRLAGLTFAGLAFTGFGHDHLDYHGTVAGYVQAKLRLLRLMRPGGVVVVNGDDVHANLVSHAALAVGATVERLDARRVRDLSLPALLPGAFNAWNMAAALLVAESVGISRARALARLANCPAVPGRLERLAECPVTYVDYAHTPESIALAVAAVRGSHPGRRLAIVFGCGGDRDPSKREPMGRAAAAADLVVITTDNSRSEDPAAIAATIRSGVGATACVALPDRGEAILHARTAVGGDGVVLVAGKGHETTQDVLGTVRSWSDRDFVRACKELP